MSNSIRNILPLLSAVSDLSVEKITLDLSDSLNRLLKQDKFRFEEKYLDKLQVLTALLEYNYKDNAEADPAYDHLRLQQNTLFDLWKTAIEKYTQDGMDTSECLEHFFIICVQIFNEEYQKRCCTILENIFATAVEEKESNFKKKNIFSIFEGLLTNNEIIIADLKKVLFNKLCDIFITCDENLLENGIIVRCGALLSHLKMINVVEICDSVWIKVFNALMEKSSLILKPYQEVINCDHGNWLVQLCLTWIDILFEISSAELLSNNRDKNSPKVQKQSLLNDANIWVVIQCGLCHTKSYTRKQALFDLRRALSVASEISSINAKISRNKKGGSLQVCGENNIFTWNDENKENLLSFWKDFFLVCESLEENQLHVIKPVMRKLDGMIEMAYIRKNENKSLIHTSWICTILQRMLFHENKSIQREGVILSLSLDATKFPLLQQEFGDEFLHNLVDSLRDFNLYCDFRDNTLPSPQNGAEFPILACHWQKFLEGCMKSESESNFLNCILLIIADFNWGSIPLYYICHALLSLPTYHAWASDDLGLLQNLVMKSIRSHDSRLRNIIQCILIRSLMKFTDCAKVSFDEVLNIFILCGMKKIFAEDQDLRAEMLDWLVKNWKTFKEVQSESYEDICQYALVGMEKYCASSSNDLIQHSYEECLAELQSCSFVILLAEYSQSSGSSENDFFLKVLKYLNSIIEKASTHLYLSKEKVHKAVSLLNHLVSMSSSKSDKSNATLYNIYFQLLRSLQAYIVMQFPSRSTNLEDANLCLTSWENLFYILLKLNPSCQWPKQLLAQFEPLVSAAKNMYLSMKKGQKDFLNLKIVLMALRCLRWICCLQQKASLSFNNSMSSYLVEYLGSLDLESSLLCQVSCKDPDERKLVEDYSVMQWSCVLFAVQIQNANNSELLNIEGAMKIFLNLVDSVTDENLPIYIEAVGSLISKATKSAKDHTELICSILDATWKAINSFTRSPAFWKCYQAFLQAFLQKSILLQPDSSILHENIKTLLLQIVSSSGVRPRLLRDAVDVCINIWTKSNGIRSVEYENMGTSNIQTTVNSSGDIPCLETNSITSNIEFLVQCLTFDHVHKKDNLALLNVLELSKNKDSNKSDSRHSSHHVPLATILMLSKLDTNSSTDCDLVYSIMEKLLELDKNISKKKLRYHQNSIQHKVKNKIFQAILLLTPYIDLERKSSAIVSCLVNNLKNEAQISVRCYMEWIIALLIYRFPSNQDLLLSHLKAESQGDCNKTGTANSSAVCSYLISALLYGLCIRSVSPQEEYFLNLVNLCLPWCMTQYFNIRLNAMAVLLRMKIHFDETSRSEILLDKYPSLSSCLLLADISTGNVGKNWNKIKENFLLFDLDPLKDLSFETVYVDIPRLFSIKNHVTREDLFHFAQSYQSSGNFCFKSHISMFNTTDKIRKKSVHWVRQEAKPITNDIVVSPDDRYRKNYGASDSEDNDLMNGLDNVQKKIMPWMDVNEITDNRSEKSINKGLVLVASLIDKPSNLGGLTRTCEIFGAESLVVQSLSCTSDKVYQSLSVTAHKWLPLKEVKPWKLPEYLMQMKKSGYTLIGTEQTAQSVCLSKYRFPVKCVVVLGNEKEGIPIPILKILDVCVQIPQKGIIRSLNVHVSGAITVWEYARQYLQT